MNEAMEPWAERLLACMHEAGKSQADLARACKIEPGSVSGWFGKGKATKMISGNHLVACCIALGADPAFIMTGKPAFHSQSHSARLDFPSLSLAVQALRDFLAIRNEPPERVSDPVMLELAYAAVEEFGDAPPSNVIEITKRIAEMAGNEQQQDQGAGGTTGKAIGRAGRAGRKAAAGAG